VDRRLDHVGEDIEVGEQVELLEDEADLLAYRSQHRGASAWTRIRHEHVLAHPNLAALEGLETVDAAKQGRLAAP
jgi:hypothetical protein